MFKSFRTIQTYKMSSLLVWQWEIFSWYLSYEKTFRIFFSHNISYLEEDLKSFHDQNILKLFMILRVDFDLICGCIAHMKICEHSLHVPWELLMLIYSHIAHMQIRGHSLHAFFKNVFVVDLWSHCSHANLWDASWELFLMFIYRHIAHMQIHGHSVCHLRIVHDGVFNGHCSQANSLNLGAIIGKQNLHWESIAISSKNRIIQGFSYF